MADLFQRKGYGEALIRTLLALAVIGVLAASCTSAPPSSSATSPSPAPTLPATSTPPTGPVANTSCPGAYSKISTDQSMEALRIAQTAWSAERALQSFLDQYRIRVVVLPFLGADTITWDNLTDGDLPTLIPYGRLLICEYAKYSARWVDRSKIRRLALVKNLKTPVYAETCMLNAITNFESATLYHSVECTSPWGVRIQQHGMHHEFWHLMAYSVNAYHDSAWVALNDPTFSYGKEGWDPVKGWTPGIKPFHPRPGFVTAYAMYTEAEDQAETYASMFVKEDYTELVGWMATDAILKGKVDYMRQFVESIDPTMNLPYLGQ